MHPGDFDFILPPERIAQHARRRGDSRMLVMPKVNGPVTHTVFRNIGDWFKPGDCLVLNNTKVFPARLYAQKQPSGIFIELFLHRELDPGLWEAKAKPTRRLREGMSLVLGQEQIIIESLPGNGVVHVRFSSAERARRLIQSYGVTPLPPYIKREYRKPGDAEEEQDRRRYQTVYAKQEGSVAAPTAGLHFTKSILDDLSKQGVDIVEITLHVGWGTFMPLPENDLDGLRLHTEQYAISETAAGAIRRAKSSGGRVIACGTTAVRALESSCVQNRRIAAGSGETDIFIYPGYRWQCVDGMITNFHLPKSSLFMLVCAFGGTENVRSAYAEAIRGEYLFYSYGDAMLIL